MSTPAGPPDGPATAPRAPELATVTSDDLVTGEAVALDLPPAGLGARIASGAIDLAVALVLLLSASVLLVAASGRRWVALVGLAAAALLAVVGARGTGRVPFAAAFGMAAIDVVVLAAGGYGP